MGLIELLGQQRHHSQSLFVVSSLFLMGFANAAVMASEANTTATTSEPETTEGSVSKAEWELGIGGTAVHIPHYVGADDARDFVLPFPYFIYRSERLNVDRNFIHGKLLERDDLKIELSLSGTPPVDSDDNDARAGMPDLDATGELGPSIQYTFADHDEQIWRADLAIRKVIGTDFHHVVNAGYTFSPQLYFSQRWQTDTTTRWQFESTLGPSYGDNRYHDFFYAVAPAYSTSEREAYDASGGFGGWRWALGLTRREGNFWFGAFVRYYDLSDAVFLDSPLVRREHSILAGVAVAWILKSNRNP